MRKVGQEGALVQGKASSRGTTCWGPVLFMKEGQASLPQLVGLLQGRCWYSR